MPGGIDNLIIREWLNGGLVPLNLALLIAIGFTLLDARQTSGRGWNKRPGVAQACAFWWIFFADGMRATLVWITLRTQNRGGSVDSINDILINGYIIAALIGVYAVLRFIFLSTPKSIGHWGWIISAISTAAFVVLSHIDRSPHLF